MMANLALRPGLAMVVRTFISSSFRQVAASFHGHTGKPIDGADTEMT
jgi:hypothetical protein